MTRLLEQHELHDLGAPTRRSPWAALLLMAAHLSVDSSTAMLSALLPSLQVRFSLGEAELAALVAALWFSTSMTQPLFGMVADRLRPHVVAAAGAGLAIALLSWMGVAPSVPILALLLLVGGLGSGAFHPSGTALVRTAWPSNPGLAVSLFTAGGTAGYAIGPIAVLLVVSRFGLAWTPVLMMPGLVVAVLVLLRARAGTGSRATPLSPRHLPRLLRGPVGLLTLATVLLAVPAVTFSSATPLWLVAERGIAPDAPLIGTTLAVYSIAAAAGGIAAAAASTRLPRRVLVPGTLLGALIPFFAVFSLEPGGVAFFAAVASAGALSHAALPILITTAQDLAPYAVATVSGLIGFALGLGGVLYMAVGQLQELLGLRTAMGLAYLLLVAAAAVVLVVFRRNPAAGGTAERDATSAICRCAPCLCPTCAHSHLPGAEPLAAA